MAHNFGDALRWTHRLHLRGRPGLSARARPWASAHDASEELARAQAVSETAEMCRKSACAEYDRLVRQADLSEPEPPSEDGSDRGPPRAAVLAATVVTLAVDHEAFAHHVEPYVSGSSEAHYVAALLGGLVCCITYGVGDVLARLVDARERGRFHVAIAGVELAGLVVALVLLRLGLGGTDAGTTHLASLLATAQVAAAVVSIWFAYRWRRGEALRRRRRDERLIARRAAAVRRAEEWEAVARREVDLARVRAARRNERGRGDDDDPAP